MTQRIAPNNQLPATHFIEMYSDGGFTNQQKDLMYNKFSVEVLPINILSDDLKYTEKHPIIYTIAIFRIRENKLPTKHKF